MQPMISAGVFLEADPLGCGEGQSGCGAGRRAKYAKCSSGRAVDDVNSGKSLIFSISGAPFVLSVWFNHASR